jgi:hypothetical protein
MANEIEELTANQVICRTIGVGELEAEIMLQEVSAQDRTAIIEHYEAGNPNSIFLILNKTTEQAD